MIRYYQPMTKYLFLFPVLLAINTATTLGISIIIIPNSQVVKEKLCSENSGQNISSFHQLLLEIQQILESQDLKGHAYF